jgi:hypothetical protein
MLGEPRSVEELEAVRAEAEKALRNRGRGCVGEATQIYASHSMRPMDVPVTSRNII